MGGERTVQDLLDENLRLRAELEDVRQKARTTARLLQSTIASSQETNRHLRAATRAAESATRAKSAFLANMSHELRTPMTAILGYTEVLLEEELEDPSGRRVELLQTINRNGQHLMRILSDILDLSKIEAGKVDLEQLPISPTEIVSDIDSILSHTAQAKGIGFEIDYAGALPARIRSDPTRLRQILMNLVGNAIKFTDAGGVRVVCRLQQRETGGVLEFSVSDTGPGLSPEAQERIFQAFSQADASTTRRFGGTGLGLAISRHLARLLGGDISVESIEGEGSTFTLSLDVGSVLGLELVNEPSPRPLEVEHPQDEDNTRAYLERVRKQGPGGRVLVVDDGEDNRRLIALTLGRAGFDVTLATHGEDAIERMLESLEFDDAPFELILMDMQMPVLDGYEATRRLRSRGVEVPIVALTAHAMKGDRETCLEAGCDDFATKPVSRRRLVETVVSFIEKRRRSG